MSTIAEKIAVMQAFERGEKVEVFYAAMSGRDLWIPLSAPRWNWEETKYRITKPEPKLRKVKMRAWFDGYSLFWREEKYNPVGEWKRVPAEDKEIEVEE